MSFASHCPPLASSVSMSSPLVPDAPMDNLIEQAAPTGGNSWIAVANYDGFLWALRRYVLLLENILCGGWQLDHLHQEIENLPQHAIVHHLLMQMLLFAHKRIEDTFACLKSTAPKGIFEMANRLCSASPNVGTVSWISAVSEFSTARSIGRNNDPNSCTPGHCIKAAQAKTTASWIVATAAPHHATGNRDLLSGFITEHDDQFVHAVDGVPMKVLARGAVVTDVVVLPDVWFVPGLKANMVSVSQLAELDYSVGFGSGECYVRSAAGGKTVGKAHLREGGLYVLDFLKVPLAM